MPASASHERETATGGDGDEQRDYARKLTRSVKSAATDEYRELRAVAA
jgi:hypothetical protein